MKLSVSITTLFGLLCACAGAELSPLVNAHAHNDYAHAHPLRDALENGFCSVEADIFLISDQLLVAHNRADVKPDRTLQSLYLDPLRERIRRNGGRVYPNGPEFTLLIDLKTEWTNTYPVLRGVLTNYADMLATFSDGKKSTNAVMVILSGNRSLKIFSGETIRYAAYDGTMAELNSASSSNLIPWISTSWEKNFAWRGDGEMPEADREHLNEVLTKAHARGRRVRFWGAPDRENFWRTLRAAGVDLINTDNLAGLSKFLNAERATSNSAAR